MARFIPKVAQNIDVIPGSIKQQVSCFQGIVFEVISFQVAQLLPLPPSSVAGFCAMAYRRSDIV